MKDWDNLLPAYIRGIRSTAKMDGRCFLDFLARQRTRSGFTAKFSKICKRLELGNDLSADELKSLYIAALFGTLCCISFNGLGGCSGEIKPELETHRIGLERDFMDARAELLATPGWQALNRSLKLSAERIFLKVVVDEENLT